jgi:SpoIIAA-like
MDLGCAIAIEFDYAMQGTASLLSWMTLAVLATFRHTGAHNYLPASGFKGWENIAAFQNHAGFIRTHQQKVERIAVIAAHNWQHWLIGAVRIFLHPEVRAYDKSHESEALQWIVG